MSRRGATVECRKRRYGPRARTIRSRRVRTSATRAPISTPISVIISAIISIISMRAPTWWRSPRWASLIERACGLRAPSEQRRCLHDLAEGRRAQSRPSRCTRPPPARVPGRPRAPLARPARLSPGAPPISYDWPRCCALGVCQSVDTRTDPSNHRWQALLPDVIYIYYIYIYRARAVPGVAPRRVRVAARRDPGSSLIMRGTPNKLPSDARIAADYAGAELYAYCMAHAVPCCPVAAVRLKLIR